MTKRNDTTYSVYTLNVSKSERNGREHRSTTKALSRHPQQMVVRVVLPTSWSVCYILLTKASPENAVTCSSQLFSHYVLCIVWYVLKNTRTYEYCSSIEEQKKKYSATVREKKSNDLEPYVPAWGPKSRYLEDTRTGVDLPYCSESTKEAMTG